MPKNAVNFQVALDVMGWRQPKREDFAVGNYGEVMFKSMVKGGILVDKRGDLRRVHDFVGKDWTDVLERMKNLGYRLKLAEYGEGWCAVFVKMDEELIDETDYQATGFKTPGEAMCHAALRRCQK